MCVYGHVRVDAVEFRRVFVGIGSVSKGTLPANRIA